ncbi:hypothetical protein Plhal703r1_c26g0109171 [Plasmopara halstedii]
MFIGNSASFAIEKYCSTRCDALAVSKKANVIDWPFLDRPAPAENEQNSVGPHGSRGRWSQHREAKLSKESEDLSRGFVSGQHQHHAHTEGLIDFEFCGITRDEDFEFQRILRGPTELLKGL